jgi:ketosteroid isomerase-like protein
VTPAADRDAVERLNAELYAAFEAADLDRMEAVWDADDPDPVVCVHPGWQLLRGRSRVLRSWAVIMANTTYIQFFLTDVAVEVHGDVGWVTCQENVLTSLDDAGSDSVIVATNVFRRRPDGWKLRVHHAAPVLSSP